MKTETPLRGGDRIKIVVFFLILAATTFFGIIPILIAWSGIYVMKKDKDFTPILNSQKYIKTYLFILGIGASIIFSMAYYQENKTTIDYVKYYQAMKQDANVKRWNFEENNPDVKQQTAMVLVGGILLTPVLTFLFMLIFTALFFRPLTEHRNWVAQNGVFSERKEKDNDDSAGIMGREKLSSFSVADELSKWNDLLEKKLISQEEFNKAKQKLLNQK